MPTTKAFELAQQAANIVVDNSGEIVQINLDSDNVTQGTTNLYLTQAKVDELNADATALSIALG